MIVDGLLLADPYMKIAERIKKPEEFLHLTDDIMNEILRSKDPVCPSLKMNAKIF